MVSGVSSCVTVKMKAQGKFTLPSQVSPLTAMTPLKLIGKSPNIEDVSRKKPILPRIAHTDLLLATWQCTHRVCAGVCLWEFVLCSV